MFSLCACVIKTTGINYNITQLYSPVLLSHWCEQRGRDPTSGPLEDVINFLAELFREGYQYRSLNSYRSAMSAVHGRIDGHTVGQHPLVVRMLKGAFNERPPVARYSSFWDIGVVLCYVKS